VSRESVLLDALRGHRQRLRTASLLESLLLAAPVTGVAIALTWLLARPTSWGRNLGAVVFVVTALVAAVRRWRWWTFARAAAAIESRGGGAANAIIATEEIVNGRHPSPHPVVRAALFDAASHHLEKLSPAAVQPLGWLITASGATTLAIGVLLFAMSAPARPGDLGRGDAPGAGPLLGAGDLRVIATPPDYAQRSRIELLNPADLVVLEGTQVRLEVARNEGPVSLVDPVGRLTAFSADADRFALEFRATSSQPLVIRRQSTSGAADRLLHLRVEPDARPLVRISQPAKDLLFGEPRGTIQVEIDARDDVGLASVSLRYTRVSGSGEAFTFQEGEWPIDIARRSAGEWQARAAVTLETLGLQDGDTLVYRAVATDSKPGAEATSSDTFLIEIGRLPGVASTGFALPEELDRQALSQQMLIIRTERLHQSRSQLDAATFNEQARLLAIEQRMVKSEFVFMTGGEVEDEVEEATHAHELAEGRLENSAQVELLTAIREMSRAEARLNAADTTQALADERAALRALQRAFDRRRYLLRTLPERARIDQSRRLTGELDRARSSTRGPTSRETDPAIDRARDILSRLNDAEALAGRTSLIAAAMIALDPASESLRKAAMPLASARGEALDAALADARRALVAAIEQRLLRAARTRIARDPLLGQVEVELQRVRGRQ
jgi:hypothetical protein